MPGLCRKSKARPHLKRFLAAQRCHHFVPTLPCLSGCPRTKAVSAPPTPRRKRSRPKTSTAQTQLTLYPHTNAATPPKRQAKPARRPPAHAAQGPAQAPTTTPKQADLFTHPLPPLPRQHLNAQDIRLTAIPIGHLATTPEKDQWLYLAAPEPTAAEYLAHGITLSRTHPLLLATLRGMQAWLAKLHEQEDPEQLDHICILRLHKTMVAELLEPEPDQSALFAAPFYWLKTF